MKILFNDVFENASVLATNQSLNYPVANIIHPFLQKRFQSTTTSSVITATWTTDQCMSCFWYAYHNLTALTVQFKNSAGTVIKTLNITSPKDIGVEYFAELTTVRSVVITISGTYIGKIAGGCCYTMPYFLSDHTSGNTDNSNSSISPYGQRLVNVIPKLRSLAYSFRELTEDLKQEIDSLYTPKDIFFDIYEKNRTKEPPIYGYFKQPFNFTYTPRRYSLAIEIGEAK